MKRKAAVAGYFYPGKAEDLKNTIRELVDAERPKEKAISVVSPHAGFEYSGPVAGAVYSSVILPDTFVILGPSHGSMSSLFAVMTEGSWETPLGKIPLESRLAENILKSSQKIEKDESAHRREHSLEVQLPFIQYFKNEISIAPICISYEASYGDLEELGNAIASGIKDFDQNVLIVASTDMSHYVSQKEAKAKDFLAIQKILNLDPKGLYETVVEEDISMCGFQPTTAALVASKKLGAKKAELIKYQTSGDRTGDYDRVVGYAGLRIT
jgi:hypothetical protein